MADMMYNTNTAAGGGDLGEDNNADFYTGMNSNNNCNNNIGNNNNNNNNNNNRQRFPGLYIGNLTWWTTDQDVINNINGIGVSDVQEVKFFENRNNGQSKGFCVVTFGSDASLPIVMEKLPRTQLHGLNPVVTPYNRQNLNLLELQNKTRPQINSNNGPINSHAAGIMGISSISGVHAGTQGLAYSAGAPQVAPGMGSGMATMNNNYNQQAAVGGMLPTGGVGGVGVPRGPSNYHTGMPWMQMRAPRPMRGPMNPNNMNPNGPMIPGGAGVVGVHQMNRMRFMQPQQTMWNNTQNAYNPNQPRLSDDRDLSRRVDDRDISRRADDRHREDGRRDDRSPPPPASSRHRDRDDSRRGEERSSSSSRHRDRDDLRKGEERSSSSSRHRSDRRGDERSSSSSRHRDDSRRGEERSSSSRHRHDSKRGEERSSSRHRDDSRRDEDRSKRRRIDGHSHND